MKPICLASSSSGNCFVFQFEINGGVTHIMVECGISIKDIYRKLNNNGLMLSDISACLITHAHGDHSSAARDLWKRGIPLFATQPTFDQIYLKGNALKVKEPNKVCDGIYVYPFNVEHDIDGAVGFVIKTAKETVLFINDHKRWRANLKVFKPDYVFIECNYDHKTVYAQMHDLEKKLNSSQFTEIEKEDFKQKIKQHKRNLNSHCSLLGTLKGLSRLDLTNCKAIFLMHLSDRYANEYRMKNEVNFATHILTGVCGKNGGIK